MSKITFDQHGHLAPYEIIDLDLEGLKWYFVSTFEKSLIREALYRHLVLLIEKLQKEIVGGFFILVDGSFISMKENPGDLDFVVFLSLEEYLKQTPFARHLVYHKRQFHERGLHVFVEYFCSEELPEFEEALAVFNYWVHLFSNTKSVNGITFPKGIIRLNFNGHQA